MNKNKWFTLRDGSPPVYETLIAAGFFLFCFAILLPDLFFLVRSPMGGDGATLKDPSVSFAVFMPAFREFRFELLEHGNILWSNLRGMGLPVLGNGVQGAPLFPLNIALVWLPDQIYWSAMPIARVVLIALGTYLLARRVFGLSVVAGLVFAILIGFNLNIVRWINHPWLNGVLAGVWYLYFSCSVFAGATAQRSLVGLHCFGLVVSVFAMVTCGFPEASAVAAMFAAFSFIAFALNGRKVFQKNLGKRIALLVSCHLVGFCLSAVQVFALVEFVDLGAIEELRKGFINATFRPDQALPFGLAQFSYFWMSGLQQNYINFYLGLFGALFFLRGIFCWPRTTRNPWIGIAFLLMMLLYVVKSFGLSTVLELIFSKIPVLNQSHFPLYFSPLLYFGIAYFVALGVEDLLKNRPSSRNEKLVNLALSLSATVGILLLCAYSINYFNDYEWQRLVTKFNAEELRHLKYFVLGAGLLNIYLILNLSDKFNARIASRSALFSLLAAAFLMLWLILEVDSSLVKNFSRPDYWALNLTERYEQTFEQAAANAPVEKHELRGNDKNGNYVHLGIASINNGISAILPLDQRYLRTKMFKSEFGGYFPIEKSRRPWSWESVSTNLVIVKTTARGTQDWFAWKRDPGMAPRADDWTDKPFMNRANPFILQGTVSGFFHSAGGVRPWIHLKGETQEFWVPGNISRQQNWGAYNGRFKIVTDWRIVIPNEWLAEDSYTLTLRQTNEQQGLYADLAPIQMDLAPMPAVPTPPYELSHYPTMLNSTLLAAAPDESLHLYYDADALPRAYIASKCRHNADAESTLDFLLESAEVLQGGVSLEDNGSLPEPFCESYSAGFKRISVESDRGSKLELGSVTGPALVIVNDYIYPGWAATDKLSGEEFEIARANNLFRAIYLPGHQEYELTLSYRPWWLKIVYGLLILAVGIVMVTWRWLGANTHGNAKSGIFS